MGKDEKGIALLDRQVVFDSLRGTSLKRGIKKKSGLDEEGINLLR